MSVVGAWVAFRIQYQTLKSTLEVFRSRVLGAQLIAELLKGLLDTGDFLMKSALSFIPTPSQVAHSGLQLANRSFRSLSRGGDGAETLSGELNKVDDKRCRSGTAQVKSVSLTNGRCWRPHQMAMLATHPWFVCNTERAWARSVLFWDIRSRSVSILSRCLIHLNLGILGLPCASTLPLASASKPEASCRSSVTSVTKASATRWT
jgi:hypothetical protein